MLRALATSIVALLPLSSRPAAARPRHHGFTGDLGLGLSVTWQPVHTQTSCGGTAPGCVSGAATSFEVEPGLAPLSVSLGWFVSREVALLARATGTSYFRSRAQILNNFYGVVVEVWPIDRLFLGAGGGFGVRGKNPILSRSPGLEGGGALEARLGFALAQRTDNDFTISLEAIRGFYEHDDVLGVALVGAWKWY
jgi:hypothetical protein